MAGGTKSAFADFVPDSRCASDGELLPFLRLEHVPVLSASPFRKSDSRKGGCQIDLLLQTRRSIYVVEIKRKGEIGEEVERDVAHKVARLSIPSDKSVRTALVYEGRLHPIVKANAYFDALVDVASLMGCETR